MVTVHQWDVNKESVFTGSNMILLVVMSRGYSPYLFVKLEKDIVPSYNEKRLPIGIEWGQRKKVTFSYYKDHY